METTGAILKELMQKVKEQYAVELDALPMKSSVREVMKDGFADGLRSGVHHMIKLLGVTVKQEPQS